MIQLTLGKNDFDARARLRLPLLFDVRFAHAA